MVPVGRTDFRQNRKSRDSRQEPSLCLLNLVELLTLVPELALLGPANEDLAVLRRSAIVVRERALFKENLSYYNAVLKEAEARSLVPRDIEKELVYESPPI
ncbi:hypothetical protein Pla144_40300 [Bythopirellula polymerisocia]|uniref:Uncharacterized protein n=1 Tax=Bythopirellula polymerisocia TaxID=2528003 RepID=A0A5C6CDD0_9BACT|nr:hypothetical protein Pla144_40300 [Bythopirellula polymerisocia]